MKTCNICGKSFEEWGNNPWPVRKDNDAICCDACNSKYVIPARITIMGKPKDKVDDFTRILNTMNASELSIALNLK